MTDKPRVLLVHPPIYDFSAYDFWMKPYGLLRVAGRLRGLCQLQSFDFLCSDAADAPPGGTWKRDAWKRDAWGRGPIPAEGTAKPEIFSFLPRYYRRFGIPRESFRAWLEGRPAFDFALVQTGMTYWYLGLVETIEEIRRRSRETRIVLGGCYASLCPEHARSLGADLVVRGGELDPLWRLLEREALPEQRPFWEAYAAPAYGVMKLADGCPFRCSYCASGRMHPGYAARPLDSVLEEWERLRSMGAAHIAFYDDALLFQPEKVLIPFLNAVLARGTGGLRFHTPNALHARLLTAELASLMVRAGFASFYLGAESISPEWLETSGAKVFPEELSKATEILKNTGVPGSSITAYLLLGHPAHSPEMIESSMRYIHRLGIRIMLAEYSPVPGTADGERYGPAVAWQEPLWHNKTAFTAKILGWGEVCRLKHLCQQLNQPE